MKNKPNRKVEYFFQIRSAEKSIKSHFFRSVEKSIIYRKFGQPKKSIPLKGDKKSFFPDKSGVKKCGG